MAKKKARGTSAKRKRSAERRGANGAPYVRVIPLRRAGDTAIVPSTAPVQVLNTPEGMMLQNIGIPAEVPLPDGGKHPLRRISDTIEGRANARPNGQHPVNVNQPSAGTRGRQAGRYFGAKKKLKTFHQPSVFRVYKDVAMHKKGAEAREIAERLKMKPGTVSWALNKLSRQLKVVDYKPAGQLQAAS